jgi:hypothetical protein
MKITIPLAVVLALTAACSTNKPLEGIRPESLTPLEVVHFATPEIQRHSPGTIAGGGLLFGGFGMEAVAASEGQKLRERCGLEDFGSLAGREFVDAAPRVVPSFAGMRVVDKPVESTPRLPDSYVLTIKPSAVWIYTFGGAQGLNVFAIATITSPAGSILWERMGSYSSKQAGRVRPIEELEADSCRLLKEEMVDAARAVVREWISDLTGGRP